MTKKRKGRTEGSGTATSMTQSVKQRRTDDTPTEERSLQVKRCEREHDEFLNVWLEPYARQCASVGRKFSVSEFCDHKSWQGISAPDHNDQPILARLLVRRVPECRSLVELRRSKWDEVFEKDACNG